MICQVSTNFVSWRNDLKYDTFLVHILHVTKFIQFFLLLQAQNTVGININDKNAKNYNSLSRFGIVTSVS